MDFWNLHQSWKMAEAEAEIQRHEHERQRRLVRERPMLKRAEERGERVARAAGGQLLPRRSR